jgi:hypothetical protein
MSQVGREGVRRGCSMSSQAPAGPASGADWSPHASLARANSAIASSLYGPTTSWSPRRIYKAEGFCLISEAPHHSFGHDLVGQTWTLDLG